MPFLDVNGTRLHYSEAGSGPETIVFSHGFLLNHKMFMPQIAALSVRYRVVAYDHRGHGKSHPCRTPFGIYDLANDAAALIRALADGPVHFAGMSTGGFVGMRLALRAPDLIKSLTLIDTSADAEDPAALKQNNQLLFVARWIGTRLLLGKVMPIMMAQPFLTDPARKQDVAFWRAEMSALDKKSVYHFGNAIFSRDTVLADLAAMPTSPPTQIIVGAQDIATPPIHARAMQTAIKGARLEVIPDAGHSTPIETPQAVTDAMTGFLAGIEPT